MYTYVKICKYDQEMTQTDTPPHDLNYIYIYIYTLNRYKIDYYSTGLTPGGNARKDKIKENIGRKNV